MFKFLICFLILYRGGGRVYLFLFCFNQDPYVDNLWLADLSFKLLFKTCRPPPPFFPWNVCFQKPGWLFSTCSCLKYCSWHLHTRAEHPLCPLCVPGRLDPEFDQTELRQGFFARLMHCGGVVLGQEAHNVWSCLFVMLAVVTDECPDPQVHWWSLCGLKCAN